MKNCICLLTVVPKTKWLVFLSKFKYYDIYVVTDNNKYDYNLIYNTTYPNIRFVQVSDQDCEKHFFINSNSTHAGFNKIIAWDRAFYYFAIENTKYDNVWFIEDDVFLFNEETIQNVDAKYESSDLLTQKYDTSQTGKDIDWVWHMLTMNLEPPYYCAMCCAIRMSNNMFGHLNDYVKKNKTLVFTEALIPTLAKTHNLQYDIPDELRTIEHVRAWNENELNRTNLFHPIKNMDIHTIVRNRLETSA